MRRREYEQVIQALDGLQIVFDDLKAETRLRLDSVAKELLPTLQDDIRAIDRLSGRIASYIQDNTPETDE